MLFCRYSQNAFSVHFSRFKYLLIRTLLLLIVSSLAWGQEAMFYIGTGDVIAINVYSEPDLNQRVRIDKSGDVRMPFIGVVNALGKTASELSSEIEDAYLDGYLVEPNVNVVIERFRPFFIKGAVKAVGAYDFQFDLSVDEAIAIAGGLTERASKRDWFLIRGPEKNRIATKAEQIVHPGDIIIIEQSMF